MTKILQSLSLKVKILLICWSFLAPVTYLLYATVSAYDKDVSFAEQERSGLEWLRPAVSLLRGVVRFEQLSADAAAGNTAAQAKLPDVSSANDASIEQLRVLQAKIGTLLQFTKDGLESRKRGASSVDAIAKAWGEAKNLASTKGGKGADFRALVTDIRGMIAHTGDTSNIILDPDLDTYYLGDVLIGAIPQAIDRLGIVNVHFGKVKDQGKRDDSPAGPVLAALIREADINRIAGGIETARAEDANFYGTNDVLQNKLSAIVEGMKRAADPLTAALTAPREPKQHDVAIAYLADLGAAYQTIWDTTEGALDAMLVARIADYTKKKTVATAVASSLVLLMVVMSYFFISRITKSIEGIASAVAKDAESLASISDLLDSAVQGAAMASTQQSAAIEETVSSMEEMGSMIALTTQNASTTKSQADEGRTEADRGKAVVADMVSSMSEIASSNDRLQAIIRVINEITDKTKVINDIAFETRLLAFNASIEAARAGAHGRGFAVVAEEVGKLANVSSKAADEVRTLLESSIGQVSSVLTETKSRVDRGQQTSTACATAFATVEESIRHVSEGIDRIASAAKEQDIGVKQTNQAMQEMEKVSQDSVRTGESLANQSAELRSTATNLQASADGMYRIVLGSHGARTSSESPHGEPPSAASRPRGKRSSNPTASDSAQQNAARQASEPGTSQGRAARISTGGGAGLPKAKSAELKPMAATAADPAEATLDRNDSRWHAA